MKKSVIAFAVLVSAAFAACNSTNQPETGAAQTTETVTETSAGQSAVQDDESQKNVVQIAAGSKNYTTLVAAVKQAGLVDVLSNAGPFTVFAPTNEAFNKLPAGTVEALLKPEKEADLKNILQYHVYVGGLTTESLTDGQELGQVNGKRVTIGVKDGVYTVNGAKILASIPASNGIIHVIDQVLVPN